MCPARHAPPWRSAALALALLIPSCAVDDAAPAASTDSESLVTASREFAVQDEPSCGVEVDPARELMIRDLTVVNDPVRTVWRRDGQRGDGAWHFGKLMTQMAGNKNPQTFVRDWLAHWEAQQTVNGLTVAPRPKMASIIDAWPKDASGALDLTKAPMRLLAIVNRFDLRNEAAGSAGEGRFVFGVLGPEGQVTQFTIILEYTLPVANHEEVHEWARMWHGLSTIPLGHPAYNLALQAVTDRFAARNARPSAPNGSAISQVRTNEVFLGAQPWELREFRLDNRGRLVQVTTALTPDDTFDGSERLVRFINAKTKQILRGKHEIPLRFEGAPFRAGVALNRVVFGTFWSAPGVTNPEARHLFAVNTCNGCHGSETDTVFTHVKPREQDAPAALSTFLTGVDVEDPVSGIVHHFADLDRRKADLEAILCEDAPGSGVPAEPLTRVH